MKSPKVLLPYHETPHPFESLDGDEGGHLLTIRIARMTTTEYVAWRQEYDQVRERASLRTLTIRREDERETKTAADGDHPDAAPEFVIPEAEIRRRRLAEMDSETLLAHVAQVKKEDTAEAEFIERTVRDLVTLAPGEIQMQRADGTVQDLISGDDILRMFGGQLTQMRSLVEAVRIQHEASASLKKAWRSLLVSGDSSAAPHPGAPGLAPETVAPAAAPTASASTAAATASLATSTDGPHTRTTHLSESSGVTALEPTRSS